jgi:hypothetical protein
LEPERDVNPGVRLGWSWQPAERVGRHRRSAHPHLRRVRSLAVDLVIVAVFVVLWLMVLTRGDVLWL